MRREQTLADRITSSSVWRSVVRHGYPDNQRNQALIIASNVFLHIHPVKIKRYATKVTYTFCLGGLSFFMFLVLVLTGVLYPLAMTGLCELLFPSKARGSLVTDDKGQVVGSALIGQRFESPAYFAPRPSAAGERGYDAAASGGSSPARSGGSAPTTPSPGPSSTTSARTSPAAVRAARSGGSRSPAAWCASRS